MRLLSLSLLFGILVAVIGLGALLDWYHSQSHTKQQASQLQVSREALANIANGYAQQLAIHPELVTEVSTQQLQVSLSTLEEFPLPQDILPRFMAGDLLELSSYKTTSIHSYQPDSGKVVSFEMPHYQHTEAAPQNLYLTLIFYAGLVAVMGVWLIPLVRRLLIISRTMAAFGQGNFTRRIPAVRFSYVKQIEEAFNQMAQRITDLIADNKMLSRAVSHDLRTPIARLRFGLEMLDTTQDPAKLIEHRRHLHRDLDEMESLVESLLSYAKMEQADIQLSPQKVNLASWLPQLVEPLQPAQHITWRGIAKPVWVILDKEYASMMFTNCLVNALRFAENQVSVQVNINNGTVECNIEDDGPGIPEQEREHVLKPFYRLDTTSKGHGMGLAIAARIANWHRVKLELTRSPALGGLRVTFQFKRVPLSQE